MLLSLAIAASVDSINILIITSYLHICHNSWKLSEVVICKSFNITSYIAAVFEDVIQKERGR